MYIQVVYDVKITGTATSGDYVIIAVDDVIWTQNVNINQDGAWEYILDSGPIVPGSHTIKAWISPTTIPEATRTGGTVDSGDEVPDDGIMVGSEYKTADASTSIMLQSPTLTASVSRYAIAKDDNINVSGTATGAQTNVLVWIFNSEGTGTDGMLLYDTVSVSNEAFDKKLASTATSKTGTYNRIFVLSKGRDGASRCDGSVEGATDYTNLTNFASQENGSQILSILEDEATKVGSDDPYIVLAYMVETPYVSLDTLTDTPVGANLTVTGTTNRQTGTTIVVTAASGSTSLTPAVAAVQLDGTFEAVMNTTGKPVGVYNITADDLIGNNATATVNLITGNSANITSFTSQSASYGQGDILNCTAGLYNKYNTSRWFVIVVSGTHSTTGYPLVGGATVKLSPGESMDIPVMLSVSPGADTGNYLLYADVYDLDGGTLGDKVSSYNTSMEVSVN